MEIVGWAKAHVRRAHRLTDETRWWAHGTCHRARIRATRWLCPPYETDSFGDLLPLQFRDGLATAGFTDGKANLVAGMQVFERQAFLHLELFASAAGVRADSAALRLLDRDGVIEPVNSGDRSRQRLLRQSR